MTIPSSKLYEWREAVDSVLGRNSDDRAVLSRLSEELTEQYLEALRAETRATGSPLPVGPRCSECGEANAAKHRKART